MLRRSYLFSFADSIMKKFSNQAALSMRRATVSMCDISG
jgi:hypothetical protein